MGIASGGSIPVGDRLEAMETWQIIRPSALLMRWVASVPGAHAVSMESWSVGGLGSGQESNAGVSAVG